MTIILTVCVIAQIGPCLLFRNHIKISHKFRIQYIGRDREQRGEEGRNEAGIISETI